jgi:hypothetical protein
MTEIMACSLSSWLRRGALLWLLAAIASFARADSLETIQLKYRMAEDLLPILQPLVPQGSVITGTGDVLLVRTDEATLEQLRRVIVDLDRAPRQLLITVGQVTNAREEGTSVRGSGTLGSGDVQVGVNQSPGPNAGAQVVVRSGSASDDLGNLASVRALEGYETYIAIGQSYPFTSTTVAGGGRYPPVVSQTTDYRDVNSGFYATPRLSGGQVTLEISPRQQRLSRGDRGAQVATAGATTTVRGRLGEWIEIGGVTETSGGSNSGLVTWGARSGSTQYSVRVKVDEVP